MSTIKAVQRWGRQQKTFFASFRRTREQGETLTVGYGNSPNYMSGGHGVPLGLAFSAPESQGRSYLILAFDNDYTARDISAYLGGVTKRFVNVSEDEEGRYIGAFATGALERLEKGSSSR